MSLINSVGDHYKYYYKFSSDGKKLFYHRTQKGNVRIAKAKIPSHLVDSILPYDEVNDFDCLRLKTYTEKTLESNIKRLNELHLLGLTQDRYDKSKQILEDRIRNNKLSISYYQKMNNEAAEERYQEEINSFGGFKNYFNQQYRNYENWKFTETKAGADILIDEGIIKDKHASKQSAKRNYKRWLVRNHPDKGGDGEECAQVISAYQSLP